MAYNLQTSHQTHQGNPAVAGARAESAPVTKAGELAEAALDALAACRTAPSEQRFLLSPRIKAELIQTSVQFVRDELAACKVGDWRSRLEVIKHAEIGGDAARRVFVEEFNSPGFLGLLRCMPEVDDRRAFVSKINAMYSWLCIQIPAIYNPDKRQDIRTSVSVTGPTSAFAISQYPLAGSPTKATTRLVASRQPAHFPPQVFECRHR
jgi:predicted secreted protein